LAQGFRGPKCCIGFLIGGDAKGFSLKKEEVLKVINQIKSACEKFNLDILVTTSRRTSKGIEALVKEEFAHYPRCKLCIIANEKNYPFVIGGILALSEIIITSCESISMISEAASSKKYILVFKSQGLNNRHLRFLDTFSKKKYIYLTEVAGLSKAIEDILLHKPQIVSLSDNLIVSEAVKNII
jgi:mitochondrial fission protein ELM1